MVKFGGDYDRGYRTSLVILRQLEQKMVETMRTAARAAYSSVPVLESRQRECLQSLAFREQNLRRDDIIPAENTCNWALTDPRYTDWVRSNQGLLWIKGNPGAGKSTIMKHIWDTMQQNADAELVASIFIHGRGVPLQKTLIGLYRALLNSLLSYFPGHLDELTRRFEEKERQFGSWENQKWDWNQPELQQFLYKFILEASRSRSIIIYIEALDECGAESVQKLLEQLKQLKISAQAQGSHLRVCFSSRHYPILGLESIPTIYVEDQNDHDIRKVTRGILHEIDSIIKRHQIENELVSKAQGGFQWAVLVAAKAAELNWKGVNAHVIHDEIRKIPSELNQLYSDLLNIADADEREQTRRLFQWVQCAQRPLKIAELREVLALDTDTEPHSITCLRASRHYCDTLKDTERRIKHLSRGLIEVRSREILAITVDDDSFVREVQFIHQSVPEFLAKDRQAIFGSFGDSYSPFGSANSDISRACVIYLGLAELPAAAKRSWYHLMDEFPLADYAAQYLKQHIQATEAEGIPQVSLYQIVERWTNNMGTFDDISPAWAVLNEGAGVSTLWPVKGSTIWHFAAWCGIPSVLGFLLQHFLACVDNPDYLGNTPLLLAIQNGHDEVACELLNHKTRARSGPCTFLCVVNPNATNLQGDKPISLAIEQNSGKIVESLVNAGADTTYYAVASRFFTTLSPSKRNSDGRILRALLRSGAPISSYYLYTCLKVWRIDLVQILLEFNVSPNYSDHGLEFRSPLMLVFRQGSLEVLELFASHPDLRVNGVLEEIFDFAFFDENERLGESRYVREDKEDLIQLLVRHKNADLNRVVDTASGRGRMSMLTAAAYQGRKRSTALLLESSSVLADCESILPPFFPYESALEEVISTPPSSPRIKQALETVFFVTDCRDYEWKVAPLLMATASRSGEIVSMLLQTGKISGTTIVDAYFVAQSFQCKEIISKLEASLLPNRRLYIGGRDREAYEIWIGPVNEL